MLGLLFVYAAVLGAVQARRKKSEISEAKQGRFGWTTAKTCTDPVDAPAANTQTPFAPVPCGDGFQRSGQFLVRATATTDCGAALQLPGAGESKLR